MVVEYGGFRKVGMRHICFGGHGHSGEVNIYVRISVEIQARTKMRTTSGSAEITMRF